MTLIFTVNGLESIWLLADRRLSYPSPHLPKDDACKLIFLETTDGVAILGYAGLGATALGTEPADWMSRVLRGRSFPLEHSLSILAEAMEKQLPRHVVELLVPAHNVIVTAFLGNEPRLYSIDLIFAPDRESYRFRYVRHVVDKPPPAKARTSRFGIGGSGALYLTQNKKWIRSLLQVVRAYDRGHVSPHVVADHLANLNNDVHSYITDKSVGPRCIVAWRHRKNGLHKDGAGHMAYSGSIRETNAPSIPAIARGIDLQAIAKTMLGVIGKGFKARRDGLASMEGVTTELEAAVRRLPDKPDEHLR